MRDFPPPVEAYLTPGASEPDTRSPMRLLGSMFRAQGSLVWIGTLMSCMWMVPQVVGPWLVGWTIDQGLVTGDTGATVRGVALLAVVTVVGASFGILFHTVIVRQWLVALYGTTSLVTRKSLSLGHVLPRRTPAGEVLSVSGSDGDQFGALMEITGRTISQLLAYLAVAVIVLRTSVELGLIVLLAAPLLVVLGAPLLRPLQRWRGIERSRNSDLTSLSTDIVAGLRILRGIGGESTFGGNFTAQSQRVREAGTRAGIWQASVDAMGVLLSGAFVVLLMWLGVRDVATGELTVGQLVSLLGYAVMLIEPMRTFVEFAQKLTRAHVSATKARAVLSQQAPWVSPVDPLELPGEATIVDEASGTRIEPGRLTMLVSAVPDDTAALADRLGRYLPKDAEAQVSEELPEHLRGRAARKERAERARRRAEQERADRERAARPWGVTVGGVDVSRVPLERYRHQVVVSDATPQIFAGTLQSAVDPWGHASRAQAERALHTAAAEDVFDAVPGGWGGRVDENGRGLSGGQRQRLVLARALTADPEVLVLVEPTSAVDAHTEARIAERLAEHRRGRTTVVVTASPLLLHHADEVVLVAGGREVARGNHADLLAGNPDYRATVVRGDDAEPAEPVEEVTQP
ncbi:ABC-type multidrug transport system fused ATPase/permease subunit [Barrientosiimonas humi]|uniref:ABC-type multidrug transport system fused ATPase/permease subunit n=1 Tax=Barrientosiimonas humi TaxID=999931 RepID=A0A542XEF2_9MICO|nr:ABC transporter ATP-binding protein [Barrientosiimonas humi]TQL34166.1 ABC-type multidrug transport system fused ATPase/permease subunit [Barrientosiimonas humi]CAG7574158.1 putative multidrug resistance ABC transporter ATP-binding/permease protein YheI [Barrientosiimonas humi]